MRCRQVFATLRAAVAYKLYVSTKDSAEETVEIM